MGLDSQLDPIECADDGYGSKEVPGELVEASCDPAPIFDAAEVVLDLMSAPVDALWAIGLLGSVAAAGDDGHRAFVGDLLPHFDAVVGLVGGDHQRRSGRIQDLLDDLTVMNLSTREREVQRPAFAIDDRVDFRRPAAAADADGLILLPPFAPLAARWAFTIVLSIM